jgi:enoyl-[acyl-carrier protein] reductase II
MTLANRYTRLVGIDYPIIQEGLGPFRTPKIAAAVSNAGGLGTVSMPGMPVDIEEGARTFRDHIEECASLTKKPFAVNIPVGVSLSGEVLPFTDSYIRAALLARKHDAQLEKQLTVMTTSAGFPGAYIEMIKDAGMIHQHKVGSTRQAVKAEEAGVDVIIAAGFEMGGHTSGKAMHTLVLVPNMTEAATVPVLLTGGARDGRGLAAALRSSSRPRAAAVRRRRRCARSSTPCSERRARATWRTAS